MLVLFETAAGYAIFKLLEEQKLEEIDSLYTAFQTVESANQIIKLKHFEKFADIAEALSATTAAIEGKISKSLKKLIKKHVVDEHEKLLVADSKLGVAIREKFSLQCLANTSVQHLMRCIRSQLDNLISGISQKEMSAMALGLAHSLSRYKLKFSPDKVDTMIVQAVSLLDDLDKELNNYTMRCREWYGWHFPELSKIVTDNIAFVKTVKIIGTREHAVASDLSDILSEELEEKVKEAAEISMGTEIAEDDIMNIVNLCDQVIDMTNYRHQLYDYLKNRMMALAPNLTVLVGDLVGARLVAHAGSLINLAKQPASTVQILGAEKALFRALKTRKDTPKYGLIYHSQLIGQCSTKNKGKMSRMLAAKAALATRVDALGDDVDINMGAEHRAKLEARLKLLEQGNMRRISGTGKAKAKFEKYHGVSEVHQYPDAADSTLPSTSGVSTSKRKRDSEGTIKDEAKEEVESEPVEDEETKPKKKKKKVKEELAEIKDEPQQKKKKKAKEEVAEIKEEPQEKKKKKKKKQMDRSDST